MGTVKEYYSIVDYQDKFVFNTSGKKALHDGEMMHRGVHLFIERPASKNISAGFVMQLKNKTTENGETWSSAVSGHVLAGETYRNAAIREAKEELGISIDPSELAEVLKLKASKYTGFEFVTLFSYILGSTDRLDPNPDELDGIAIHKISDIEKRIVDKPVIFSPVFIRLFNKFLHSKWSTPNDT